MHILLIITSLLVGLGFSIDRIRNGEEGGCLSAAAIGFCFVLVLIIVFFMFLTSML